MNTVVEETKQSFSTLRNIAYMFTTFFTSLFYFVFLVTGIALGVGLSITIIGLPILAGVLRASRSFMAIEKALVGETYIHPVRNEIESFFAAIKTELTSTENWKNVAFLLASFPLGVVSFVLAITFTTVPLALICVPLFYKLIPVGVMINSEFRYEVDSLPEALVITGIGLLLAYVLWNALNYVATGMMKIVKAV
ncbi:hypothetical protein EJF36_03270 [Bacillus sp. HMF5848]|uniref:sensor domain-containing protein n=1 Tax=Bacillus sp. HMF5848 TaxID=2495421 RepID=UPI000F775C3C|nr:sensor domain-containing protein [Bacillus sp. HMF5848]RSK25996.1 hypothetical protein EJF36_03270 [Bacillus sp. HMF5848]